MREHDEDSAWREAMRKFSDVADGFCILGFDKVNKKKFVFGLNKNPATKDGLFLIQCKAMEWTGGGTEDTEEE